MTDLLKLDVFRSTEVFRSLQEQPLGFIDVGARDGIHSFIEPVATATSVLGFEPDAEECKRLLASKETSVFADFLIEPVALGQDDEERTLYLQSAATNTSLLRPNKGFVARYDMSKWQTVGEVPLRTQTLDEVLFGSLQDRPTLGEFIKLDTQGTEHEILSGATKTLKERTVGVICEVSFCHLYDDQMLFTDVEQLLRHFGFSFYGFGRTYTRSRKQIDKLTGISKERLIQADAFFFKDVLPGGQGPVCSATSRRLQMLFLTALLCGYYEFALEVAETSWADAEELAKITEVIRQMSAVSLSEEKDAVDELQRQIAENPQHARMLIGNFVDERRQLNDVAFTIHQHSLGNK